MSWCYMLPQSYTHNSGMWASSVGEGITCRSRARPEATVYESFPMPNSTGFCFFGNILGIYWTCDNISFHSQGLEEKVKSCNKGGGANDIYIFPVFLCTDQQMLF